MNEASHPVASVLVVDGEASVAEAVSRVLRGAGFAEVSVVSVGELMERPLSEGCGCVVIGIAAGGSDGLEVQRELVRRGVNRPVVFLAASADVQTGVRAMKHGAFDFLTRPFVEGELVRAVRDAVDADRAAWRQRVELANVRKRFATLTPREREVLVHVISGWLNKQTAAELGTVEKTIKVHRAHVMDKLQVASLADLVRLAERAGVSPLPQGAGQGWGRVAPAAPVRRSTAGPGVGTKVQ